MGDIRDSTDTYYREKLEHKVRKTVHCELDSYIERIKELEDFQERLRRLIMGDIPPDPDKPSIWQALIELMKWKTAVNKFLWIAVTALIGAGVTAIFTL